MNEKYARGPSFVFAKEYVIKTNGEQIWDAVLKRLPPEYEQVWRGTLLISDDFPFQAFRDMIKAWSETTGAASNEATATLYGYIADRSLSSVYRFFFKFAQPALVLKNFPKLWARFFNTGTVTVPMAEKGHAVIQFQLPEIFQGWLEPACYGYSKKAIEMAGGKNVKMMPSGKELLQNGTLKAAYELTWTE
ncbi:MAG: hypothetical protein KJ620_04005 [Candidatus Edwardsbacteria bacterium]|nr:hypothetical protein [Candidatus Edwardsbacteria bacterium]MBU1577196.1 hypothetical protein [Candidatus Edwardsbacteria bacterium]MBU2463729.1 hypothetical protein [Candidatus Edwardsbacteria bacterium]MBU2594097.1 hypothetical protein [Candidatus Edwardsbacteria bacterium]